MNGIGSQFIFSLQGGSAVQPGNSKKKKSTDNSPGLGPLRSKTRLKTKVAQTYDLVGPAVEAAKTVYEAAKTQLTNIYNYWFPAN